MPLSLLDSGQVAVSCGKVSASGTAALTSNDASAELTDNGTGDFTITFGAPFNSEPYVVATCSDATHAATESHAVAIVAYGTDAAGLYNTVQFNVMTNSQAAGTDATNLSALADIDFEYVVIGSRNR